MKLFLNPMKLRRPMAWLLAAAMMGQNLPLFAVAEDSDPDAGAICGYVTHVHGDGCDILQNKLTCKLPEGEGHTHDVQKCFRQEQKLICQEEHEHAEACHETVNVQICPLQEYVAHTHGDACYTQEKVRICTVTEHTHTEQCYPVVVPETTGTIETCEHCGVELVENAVHAEDCLTRCTCGQETHVSGCPLYVAPKTCEHCGVELVENVVHAENCLTRCTCGQETHVSGCPLYVAPKTCEHCGVELVENAVHAEDCLTRCTCGQETHVSPCPLYVEPELSFYEKLMTAKTMEEFFQLMNSDVDSLMAFTTEEVKALKEHVEKTYAAMKEPSQDEQDYYAEILAGFDVLLEEESEDFTTWADGYTELTVLQGNLSTGKYRLVKDTELTGLLDITSGNNVTIDLNGFMLKGCGTTGIIKNRGTLTIEDSRPTVGTHKFRKKADGPWILVSAGTTGADIVTVTGGIITGGRNQTEASAGSGGGGAIQNLANDTARASKVYLKGGTIVGNSSKRAGGGVYGGAIYMTGGAVRGNYAASFGGGLSLSGSFEMSGGLVEENNTSPTSSKNTAPEASNYDNAGVIIGFQSSFTMTGGTIRGNVSTVYNTGGKAPDFHIKGGLIEGNFRLLNRLSATFSGGELKGYIYMNDGTCTVEGDALIHEGTRKDGGAVCIRNGTFTMTGGTIENASATETGGAIHIDEGTCTISGGIIQNCKAVQKGGAVYLGSGGSFTMTGGTICNNGVENNAGDGGAIYLASGDAVVSGGSIHSNHAKNGGGAYLNGGSVNMTAGFFYENTATENGGGVAVYNGNFSMSGGSIGASDQNPNQAAKGGGVYVEGGDVNITGTGIINHNMANYGGGIYLTGGDFTQNGADTSIENNTATYNGGGVYLDKITPELESGKISGNTANGNGGGIYIDQQPVNLTPNGAVSIIGNTAVGKGGGICISGTTAIAAGFAIDDASAGSITMTGNEAAYGGAVCIENGTFDLKNNKITVTGNEANNGGGVAVLSGTFNMTGGSVGASDAPNKALQGANTSGGNGGGVYVSGGRALVSGGKVEYNLASNGGGIYVSIGDVEMTGGEISHNSGTASGGGIFVEAGNDQNAVVGIFSGTIQDNTTNGGGGAVSIMGSDTSDITVQIGVNKLHEGDGAVHIENDVLYAHCPVIQNNRSGTDGGAVFIKGGSSTNFSIYCLKENNNIAGTEENARSNFMKVEGGTVLISTSKTENGLIDGSTSGYGYIDINGSVHVTGGKVDIYGVMTNPDFADRITVDVEHENDYEDHRPKANETKKLRYFENFQGSGQYTDYHYKENQAVDIAANIYSHPGYKIVGWFTSKDGEGDEYIPGQTIVLKDNLVLYAIWEVYGYTVEFNPNCDAYGGTKMEPQKFTLYLPGQVNDTNKQALSTNTYTRQGHMFVGWDTSPTLAENQAPKYTNGAQVINLGDEDGEVVTLYAHWQPCDHGQLATFTYSVETTVVENDTLVRSCDCGGQILRARLTAPEGAVYDSTKEHPAELICDDATLFNPAPITYNPALPEGQSVPVNAGTYTASVSKKNKDGTVVTASVSYVIDKAQQPAPEIKPTYTIQVTGTGDTGQTYLVVKHMQGSIERGTEIVYGLEYKQGTETKTEEKGPFDTNQNASFDLNYALTEYSVYVKYGENQNYYASPITRADKVYYFEGDVTITVDCCEGISYVMTKNDSGVTIDLTDDTGYYRGLSFGVTKYNGSCTLTKTTDDQYQLTEISANSNIKITISGMEKKAGIAAAVVPGQNFGTVTGTDPVNISRDSAFTASFAITDYSTKMAGTEKSPYGLPQLSFYPALPSGTTIILKDHGNTNGIYWKHVVSSTREQIAWKDFTRMGGSGEYTFRGNSTLQFIVDFSQCESYPADNTPQKIFLTMDGNSITENGKTVKVEDVVASASANLGNGTFELSSTGDAMTKEVTYSYSVTGTASRWEGRNSALVMTPPAGLPEDAVLRVYDSGNGNGTTTVYRKNAEGNFIIPLSGVTGKLDSMTLESSRFPQEETTYTFSVKWYVSNSKAGSGPMNGSEVLSETIAFMKPEEKTPSAKIVGTKRLCNSGETLDVTIKGQNLDALDVMVRLYYKDVSSGTENYIDTAFKQEYQKEIWSGDKTLSINMSATTYEQKGTYRLELIARDDVTILLDNIYYYFILQ